MYALQLDIILKICLRFVHVGRLCDGRPKRVE